MKFISILPSLILLICSTTSLGANNYNQGVMASDSQIIQTDNNLKPKIEHHNEKTVNISLQNQNIPSNNNSQKITTTSPLNNIIVYSTKNNENTNSQAIQSNNNPKPEIEYYDKKIVTISPQVALPIGIKIWFNECGGEVGGLTSWNKGENFASLGIAHFIWHPNKKKNENLNGGFPKLIKYIEETHKDVNIPKWLRKKQVHNCPWRTRKDFLKAKNSPKMRELRVFLQKTIPIQAEYLTRSLQEILPDLLASTPISERKYIHDKFYTLAKTPSGIYAMVDYLNFKGAGISRAPDNYKHGTGLLHVIKGMKNAPTGSTNIQAFVWSAKNALIKRVERSPASRQNARWLSGWFKRVDTYLEGDPELALNNIPATNINTHKNI